jgi:AraC-like DNA-binding protein/mannose-6-phosphate isomerase-like protein (cupin superfamily)
MADFRVQQNTLWPDQAELPVGSPRYGEMLRMYAPNEHPRSGSLYMDEINVDTAWHYHDMHQLTYAFKGSVAVEDSTGKYVTDRNLATWIPAGVCHRARIHGAGTVIVYFKREQIDNPGERARTFIVSPLMKEMMREVLRWPLYGPDTPLRSFFIDTMALLSSEAIEQEVNLVLPTCKDPRVDRALTYTLQHPDAKLSDVCAHAGMSERTLRRRILAEVGMTWEAYRQLRRLQRAMSLLSELEVPITEVAAQCGFESPSAFSRAFRLSMHEAPREYRNRLTVG